MFFQRYIILPLTLCFIPFLIWGQTKEATSDIQANEATKTGGKISIVANYSETPLYPGANEYAKSPSLLPSVYYQSENIIFDLPQLTLFVNYSDLLLSVSFSPSFGLESEDPGAREPDDFNLEGAEIERVKSYRRRGLDDIPAMLVTEFAAKYTYEFIYFSLAHTRYNEFGAGFGNEGGKTTPSVGLSLGYTIPDSELNFYAGAAYSREYGDKIYNTLFFGVNSEDVLPGRPEYDADAGLIQDIAEFTTGLNYGNWNFEVSYSYFDMNNSEVKESPLVINQENIGRSYTLQYKLYTF